MKTAVITMIFMGTTLAAICGWTAASRFIRDTTQADEPTVSDAATGLEWQGCARGLTGVSCETGTLERTTWSEALTYCEGLSWGGHSDWRLPNKKELRSLVDSRKDRPSIDATSFPATPSQQFWSSSSYADSAVDAWGVNFNKGDQSRLDKTTINSTRCVRILI